MRNSGNADTPRLGHHGEFTIGRNHTQNSFRMRGGSRNNCSLCKTQEATLSITSLKSPRPCAGTGLSSPFPCFRGPHRTQGSRIAHRSADALAASFSAFHARITAMPSQPFTLDEDGSNSHPVLQASRYRRQVQMGLSTTGHQSADSPMVESLETFEIVGQSSQFDNAQTGCIVPRCSRADFPPESQDELDRGKAPEQSRLRRLVRVSPIPWRAFIAA